MLCYELPNDPTDYRYYKHYFSQLRKTRYEHRATWFVPISCLLISATNKVIINIIPTCAKWGFFMGIDLWTYATFIESFPTGNWQITTRELHELLVWRQLLINYFNLISESVYCLVTKTIAGSMRNLNINIVIVCYNSVCTISYGMRNLI